MNEQIHISEDISVVSESDVLVIGGGVAGVAAALAVGRSGQKVVLIEKSIVLGGLATLGHVCVYLAICDGAGNKVYGGLPEELLRLSVKYGYNNIPTEWKDGPNRVEKPTGRYKTQFNVPAFVMALDELMEQEGIQVVFDTVFSVPIMEGDICKGVIVENKSGRTAYLAKIVIDASGDADVFARAGAECVTSTNIVSHWTYELDFAQMKKGLEKQDMLSALNLRWIGLRPEFDQERSKLPLIYGHTAEGVNAYIKLSRKVALDFLKKNQRPDYAMLTLPFAPQFRKTRRIKGLSELKNVPETYQEHSIGCVCNSLQPCAPVYEVPYECLIDPNIKNMLAAGRIVAGEDYCWDLMRFIPACALSGQAAGQAAANAIKENCSVQNININKLQHDLTNSGTLIHMPEYMKCEKKKENSKYLKPELSGQDENIVMETTYIGH